jgi:hypothetical protein
MDTDKLFYGDILSDRTFRGFVNEIKYVRGGGIMDNENKNNTQINLIIFLTIVSVLVLMSILICVAIFCFNLDISNGNWTQLVGAYIGFLGSAILAMISYHQSEKVRLDSLARENKIRTDSKNETELRTIRETQPIIVIKKVGNAQNNYFDCKLCNYGKYPILNVAIFGRFYDDVVMPLEADANDGRIPITRFITGNNPPGGADKSFDIAGTELHPEHKIPQSVDVEYEDIYGNVCIQTFILDEEGRYRVKMQNGSRAAMKRVMADK